MLRLSQCDTTTLHPSFTFARALLRLPISVTLTTSARTHNLSLSLLHLSSFSSLHYRHHPPQLSIRNPRPFLSSTRQTWLFDFGGRLVLLDKIRPVSAKPCLASRKALHSLRSSWNTFEVRSGGSSVLDSTPTHSWSSS